MNSPREKILILDGDESAGMRLLELLRSAGYDVFLTSDCRQALERVRAESTDHAIEKGAPAPGNASPAAAGGSQ